ncbi:unnamed protein product [Aspergillus oryzae]|nr:unnamed protein product [Aspergillus oryzae]GMF94164.1 unnamed protein product [Aspergillus oryzae]GMG07069.1 unnamed protein product [Aspergillus oryzae]GMG47800.1 unnamed protein product [Aspergillus oryzae var. brunneus]
MLFIKAIALTGLAVSQVSAHGLITRVKGHNGIDMPGLTIIDVRYYPLFQFDQANSSEGRQLINDAAGVITNAGGAILNGVQSTIDDAMAILPGTESGAVTGKGVKENGMQLYAGKGANIGLPTASPDGVNQDGAGPLSAEIDPSSGGTDPKAFKSARVIQNIPGVAGFSTSSAMDYAVKVQVPQGMKCTGTVGAAKNVCIVRVRNNAISGPFGGSGAFTQ